MSLEPLDRLPDCGQIWNLLTTLGLFTLPPACGKFTEFLLPSVPTSQLVGIPYEVQPVIGNRDLRILTFINQNFSGPITSSGVILNIFNNFMNYEVKWEILGPERTEDLLIGFYTSGNPFTIRDNQLDLIISKFGPAIFEATGSNSYRGFFSFGGISQMYVVINTNASVHFTITTVPPESKMVPCLRLDSPYTYYLRSCAGKDVVAQDELIVKRGGVCLRKPDRGYRNLSDEMNAFMESFRLSLTLLSDNPALSIALQQFPPDIFTDVPFYPSYFGAESNSITTGFPGKRCFWWGIGPEDSGLAGGSYFGLKFQQETGNPSFLPTLFYDITVRIPFSGDDINATLTYNLTLLFRYTTSLLWRVYKQMNGNDAVFTLGDMKEGDIKTFTGSVTLPPNIIGTIISLKYGDISFDDSPAPGFPEVIGNSVRIEYNPI